MSELVRILAPSQASADCLLAELAPFGRAQAVVGTMDGGCELVVLTHEADTPVLFDTVSEWLRTCNLASIELRMDGRTYTVTQALEAVGS